MGLFEWVVVLAALLLLVFAHIPPLYLAVGAVVIIIASIAWRGRRTP